MPYYLIAVLCGILLLIIFLFSPGDFPKSADKRLWAHSYAHRGLHTKDKTVPENSLAAFGLAAEAGYGIELDLNLTTDNRVVVFHDDSLTRVCGVEKKVAECTYEDLACYPLQETNERIPLLEEVLGLVDGRVPLIVELKATKRNDELCRRAVELLDSYHGPYCIESFHPGIVRWFRKNRPAVVRGQLSAGLRNYKGLPFWQGLMLSSLLTNAATRPHFVAYRHEDARRPILDLYRFLGGRLVGWTVRDTDPIAYCQKRFDIIIFEFFLPAASGEKKALSSPTATV